MLSMTYSLLTPYLGQEDAKGIKSTIDVRCRTLSGVHTAVEMQRKFKEYYLARSQDYMAKLLISKFNMENLKPIITNTAKPT
jgi:hypothetical protein